MGKVGSVRPIGGEDTAKLPCLEEGAAAACSMPLKPGTLWRQLAILVGASLGKFEFKTSCCLIKGQNCKAWVTCLIQIKSPFDVSEILILGVFLKLHS